MNIWEILKREIGNPLTTVYCHRGNVKEYKAILKQVEDCFSIDYGSDYMDFNFADAHYNIYQLINNNGTIIYENPRALEYQNLFKSFDDVIDERYRLFGADYIKASIKLKNKFIYNTVKYSDKFRTEFKQTINDSKNNLSFWFPLIQNIGFKTPKTETFTLTSDIIDPLINFINTKQTDFNSPDYLLYENNILKLISTNTQFVNGNKLFIKSGVFSNKFDFDTCKINNFAELPFKFYQIFKREFTQARGTPPKEIVVREFIETNNRRKTIYNGMPLNTEFRVFYDFDNKKVLGIENYWNQNEMESGLRNNQDINNYLDEKAKINYEFKVLKPKLLIECEKLKFAPLSGNWSVDFMWNGEEFVLIDMALAECSSFWEKYQHLSANGLDISSIEIPEGVLPRKVISLINKTENEDELIN